MAGISALLAGVLSSLFFITLNVAMNIYMKWLFAKQGGDFALPWTMLAVQQLQAYLVLQPCIARLDPQRWGWPSSIPSRPNAAARGGNGQVDEVAEGELGWINMLQVLAVTTLFCLNVGLNSLSLVQISITLNQTVRAFLPVGVLVLATLCEERRYSTHSYVTTVVLVLGIALTCWGSPDFQFDGFLLAFLSTLVAALGTSLNGRLLSKGPFSKSGPYGVARLIMLQSVPAFFTFTLVAGLSEGRRVWEKLSDPSGRWQWYQTLMLVSGSSALALLSNLGRCFLVAATSALMETLAGNAKVAALCVIDHQLFGTALHSYNYAGIGLTFMGFSIHVLLQYAQQEPERPVEAGSGGGVRFQGRSDQDSPQGPSRSTARRRTLNRPRLISAAETGLAAEHIAVDMGRQTMSRSQSTESNRGCEEGIPEIVRRRSMTWPATRPDATQSYFMNVDLSLVLEVPPWLTSAAGPSTQEDYSPISVASLSPRRAAGTPQARSSAKPLMTVSPSRSRFFTDPVESLNSRPRGPVDDPARSAGALAPHLLAPVEEEPLSPPNLDWL